MFLCIENKGVCPIQGFDLLGASTAKGTDKIGQFGTGAKHAINLLLRRGENPIIYLGEKQITWFTREESMGDRNVHRVYYRHDAEVVKTSWCTDFGDIDWGTNKEMALREFVSNAIDQNNGKPCNVNLVSEHSGKKGVTRIYVEADKETKQYWANIDEHFRQFADDYDSKKLYFPNKSNDGPTIYRRGVKVKTESKTTYSPALYNYDIPDLKIDECRNMNNSVAINAIAQVIGTNLELLGTIIKRVMNSYTCWEYDCISSFWMPYLGSREQKDLIAWWKDEFGNLKICSQANIQEYADKKGIPCLYIKNWFDWLAKNGIPTMDSCVSPLIQKGMMELDVTSDLEQCVDFVWNFLLSESMTGGKKKPLVKMFESNQDAQSQVHGIYKDGVIYIHRDKQSDFHTILHELAHYITGANDCTHDFQEFAFKAAGRALMKMK